MRISSRSGWWTSLLCAALTAAHGGEVFHGALAGWANAKADYGAVGDGKADDTAALQRALDDLREHRDHTVLYLPAGTYRVTAGLHTDRKAHTDGMGINVVGEDPATTTLLWDGPETEPVLRYDAWYSSLRRLSIDGGGKAVVGLQYGPKFSTYNETADVWIRGCRVGLLFQTPDGAGQAENLVLRCRFTDCTRAGLMTANWNSMDIWAWYCRFERCDVGMRNEMGNFHAYANLFLGSTKADISSANLMVFSFIGNTSIGSQCFVNFAGQHTWGSPCSITHNRIVDTNGAAILLGNGGPWLVMDNQIRSRPGVTAPQVWMTWGDQALIGNQYSLPPAQAVKETGRFVRYGERQVAPESISADPPQLPGAPPYRPGSVIEVPLGAGAAAIQAAIDQAARAGQPMAVHLPRGDWPIDRTLELPPEREVELLGDGAAETGTVLHWKGPHGGSVLQLRGPSHARLTDLSVLAPTGSGIVVDACDQANGRIYLSQANLTGIGTNDKAAGGLRVEGLEQTGVLAQALQGGSLMEHWVEVAGGQRRKPSPVAVYCGATGTSERPYTVTRGGRLLVRSVYHEIESQVPQALALDDSGELSIDATRFSYQTAPDRPLIAVKGFEGSFALLSSLLMPVNSPHTARVSLSGSGAGARVLLLGDLFWVNELGADADRIWHDETSPAAHAGMLLCNMNSNLKGATPNGFGRFDPRGDQSEANLLDAVKPIRDAWLWLPGESRPGVTNLVLHRVSCRVGAGGVGLRLSPKPAP